MSDPDTGPQARGPLTWPKWVYAASTGATTFVLMAVAGYGLHKLWHFDYGLALTVVVCVGVFQGWMAARTWNDRR